ncbi:MAG: hypothetical protein GX802_08595, partial [Clostridiales bacterium]|nr:hypothetical protein [Clostridiales bacterium]
MLILYGFGSIGLMFGFFYSALVEPFHAGGIDWLYFLFSGLAATGIMFVSSIFTAQTQLFESRDNDLLLALPIPPSYLLLSRMSVLLIICYFLDLVVFLPALIVYLMNYTLSVAQIVCYFGVFLVLPLFAIALASLFGWLLALLTSRMRNKTVFTMILSLAFLGGYFYVNAQVQNYIEMMATHGEAIANTIKSTVFP